MNERSMRGKTIVLVLAALILAADLWSKHVAFETQTEHRVSWVVGEWLGLTKTTNVGVMWGGFSNLGPYLPYLRLVAALIVLIMAWSTPREARLVLWALGLVLGGALGNIYDGLTLGAVRDFIYVDLDFWIFDPFPVFNVADSGICVGVGLLALSMLGGGGATPATEPPGPGA